MLPLALAGVGLAAKGYNMYQASQREKQAMNALKDLAKTPYAKYGVNPLVQRYTQMGLRDIQNPQGFSGAETGAFNQGLAQSQAGARQNALSIGGISVSRAVNAGLNSANLGALNQFAGQNAALARQNRNLGFNRYMQGAGIAQNVDNMNTQGELNRRMMLEQAYGAAARQNRDIFSQGLEGMGNDLLGAGLYKGLNEGFMGGVNALATPQQPTASNYPLYQSPYKNPYSFSRYGRAKSGGVIFEGMFSPNTGSPVDLRGK